MTNKRLIIIVGIILLITLGWWWMKKANRNAPQPILWSATQSGSGQSLATNNQNDSITLSDSDTYLVLDYNPQSNLFITYLPEKNELWQIKGKTEKKLLTTFTNLTVLSASISPNGQSVLIRTLLDSGNQQLLQLDLTSLTQKALPNTVLQALWLPDNKIVYLFDDGKNRTLSITPDSSVSSWSVITTLPSDFIGSQLAVDPAGKYAVLTSPHSSNISGQSLLVDLTNKSSKKIADNTTGTQWAKNGSIALMQQIENDGKPALLVLDPTKNQPSKIANATAPVTSFKVDHYVIGVSPSKTTGQVSAFVVDLDSGKSTSATLSIELTGQITSYIADSTKQRLIISDGQKIQFFNFSDLLKTLNTQGG